MIHAMNDGFNEMFCGFIYEYEKSVKNIMNSILTEYNFRCDKKEPAIKEPDVFKGPKMDV